jgi:hypothetical protein
MTKDEALKMAINTMEIWNGKNVKTNTASFMINFEGAINACKEALEQPVEEPVADDELHLAKHAKEYHGLTLNQFKLMCDEAHKRYEGKFSNSVDKALAVESFYEGFKVGCTHPHQWQGLTDDEILAIPVGSRLSTARAIEQALKDKNT